MRSQHSQGFILTMVLITLTIVALIMSYLTQNTQMLINQTHRQQIAAINRNLILSAKAWAGQHNEPKGKTIVLDANDLSTRATELSIEWIDPNHIDIKARASWATLNLKQEQQFEL